VAVETPASLATSFNVTAVGSNKSLMHEESRKIMRCATRIVAARRKKSAFGIDDEAGPDGEKFAECPEEPRKIRRS
jgi:hypothetical protein